MTLIFSFAGLCMCSAALAALLPEGSLRRAAMLAMGLLLMSMWAEGLSGMLQLPWTADAPASLLEAAALPVLEQRVQDAQEEQRP